MARSQGSFQHREVDLGAHTATFPSARLTEDSDLVSVAALTSPPRAPLCRARSREAASFRQRLLAWQNSIRGSEDHARYRHLRRQIYSTKPQTEIQNPREIQKLSSKSNPSNYENEAPRAGLERSPGTMERDGEDTHCFMMHCDPIRPVDLSLESQGVSIPVVNLNVCV